MKLEIFPVKGLNEITFGMTREAVEAILGKPTEVEIDSEDGIVTEHWHYDDQDISLLFSKEHDYKLLSIALSNENATLEGEKLIGLTEAEMLDVLERLNVDEDLEYEDVSSDEFPDHILVYCYDLAMNLWLDNGVLSEVQWGPIMNEDETIEWPN